MKKRVLIVIPVYNDVNGLVKTLTSIRLDSERYDVLVVDDGSDNLIEASVDAKEFGIVVLRNAKNLGIENSLNRAIKYAVEMKYDFISRIDGGDYWVVGRLFRQLSLVKSDPELVLVGGAAQHIDENGRLLFIESPPKRHEEIRAMMHIKNCFIHPSVLLSLECLQHVGNYSSNYKAAEDYELFFRIVERFKVANLSDVIVVKVRAENSISVRKRKTQITSRIRVKVRHFRIFKIICYIGLLRELAMLLAPVSVIDKLKK